MTCAFPKLLITEKFITVIIMLHYNETIVQDICKLILFIHYLLKLCFGVLYLQGYINKGNSFNDLAINTWFYSDVQLRCYINA